MQLDKLIRQVSKEMGLPYDVCHRAYMYAWKFIYNKVQEQNLSIETTSEEFLRKRPNINVNGIGKFNITPEDFERKQKKYRIIEQYKKEKDAKSNKDD